MKKVFIIFAVAFVGCSKDEVPQCCKEVVNVYSEISMASSTIGRTMWYVTKRDCEGNIVNEFVYMGSTRPQIYIGNKECD